MTIEDYMISEDMPLLSVMKKMNDSACGTIFICKNGILLAAISDGDVRRSIMKGVDLNTPACEFANYSPIYLEETKRKNAEEVMKAKVITALPIVNEQKKIVDIKFLLKDPFKTIKAIDVPVVIMAGGKGSRLKPFTDILPKPLIPVGDKTITEHIIEHFEKYGCSYFNMIINYKKNFIKSYFADSENKRNIDFTEEESFLGTGGGIALVEKKIQGTFFLTNCDIIIETDYSKLLEYHKKQGSIITIVCAKKKVLVPYGTVQISADGYVEAFKEKPCFEFNTSTGLYVIEPRFLSKIPKDTFIDITDIIQKCIDDGEKVGTYLIDEEDWMDMGQLEEMKKMRERMSL